MGSIDPEYSPDPVIHNFSPPPARAVAVYGAPSPRGAEARGGKGVMRQDYFWRAAALSELLVYGKRLQRLLTALVLLRWTASADTGGLCL